MNNLSSAILEPATEALPVCLCITCPQTYSTWGVVTVPAGRVEGGSEEEPWPVGGVVVWDSSLLMVSLLIHQPPLGILGLLNIRYKSVKLFIVVFI